MKTSLKKCLSSSSQKCCSVILLVSLFCGCSGQIEESSLDQDNDGLNTFESEEMGVTCQTMLDCFPGSYCNAGSCTPYTKMEQAKPADFVNAPLVVTVADSVHFENAKTIFYLSLKDRFLEEMLQNIDEVTAIAKKWGFEHRPYVQNLKEMRNAYFPTAPEAQESVPFNSTKEEDLNKWKQIAQNRFDYYDLITKRIAPLGSYDSSVRNASIEANALFVMENVLAPYLTDDVYRLLGEQQIENIANKIADTLMAYFKDEGLQVIRNFDPKTMKAELAGFDGSSARRMVFSKAQRLDPKAHWVYIDLDRDIKDVLKAPVEQRGKSRLALLAGWVFNQTNVLRGLYRTEQLKAPLLDVTIKTFPKTLLSDVLVANPDQSSEEFKSFLDQALEIVVRNQKEVLQKLSKGGEWANYSHDNLEKLGEAELLILSVLTDAQRLGNQAHFDETQQVANWLKRHIYEREQFRQLVLVGTTLFTIGAPFLAPTFLEMGVLAGYLYGGVMATVGVGITIGYGIDAVNQWRDYKDANSSYFATVSEADIFKLEILEGRQQQTIASALMALQGVMTTAQGLAVISKTYGLSKGANGLQPSANQAVPVQQSQKSINEQLAEGMKNYQAKNPDNKIFSYQFDITREPPGGASKTHPYDIYSIYLNGKNDSMMVNPGSIGRYDQAPLFKIGSGGAPSETVHLRTPEELLAAMKGYPYRAFYNDGPQEIALMKEGTKFFEKVLKISPQTIGDTLQIKVLGYFPEAGGVKQFTFTVFDKTTGTIEVFVGDALNGTEFNYFIRNLLMELGRVSKMVIPG